MNKTKSTISKKMNSTSKSKNTDQMNNTQSNNASSLSQTIRLPLQNSLSSSYVRLISNNDYEFLLPLKVAECSLKIKQQIRDFRHEQNLKQGNIVSDKNIPFKSTSNLLKIEAEKAIISNISTIYDDNNKDIISLKVNFRGEVVEALVDYLNYKYYYENINVPDNMKQVPAFDIREDLSLEVLIISNEFGC